MTKRWESGKFFFALDDNDMFGTSRSAPGGGGET